MKNAACFYALFLMILSAGCKKDQINSSNQIRSRSETKSNDDEIFLSGYKNDLEFWKTNTPYCSIFKKDKTIWIGGYKKIKPDSEKLQELLIMQLEIPDPSNLKNTTIKSVEFETIFDGDIVIDRYVTDTTNINNQVTITEIDETKKIVKGEFNVSLIRDPWFSSNGEKVAFKSGLFVVKYTEN